MKALQSISLKSSASGLEILDQTALPQKEIWIKVQNPEEMISIIRQLKVRGAPLIGVAAALSLAHFAKKESASTNLRKAALALREARPTAVNLMNAMDRMLEKIDLGYEALVTEAEAIFNEDVELCEKMATFGAELVPENGAVLTHCNTGGLATVGVGTALGCLAKAKSLGKSFSVWVDETRPLLQGGRLTTWELDQLKIPYRLICDNMAAMLMAQGKVNAVMVGSDRIALNGDFANKIGTYSLAVNAFYHRIPFYVVAPQTTVDVNCESGKDIPIEERISSEVRGVTGSFGAVTWAPEDCEVFNPAFDVTPAELVTAWVLDRGIFKNQDVANGVLRGGK